MAAAMPIRTNWHEDKKHSDVERWVCFYPAYINSKKTRQEGRRLPKNDCVENPTFTEMRDVLSVTNLQFVVDNKQYSRERSHELAFRGRLRVQIKNADGSLCNNEFASRDHLFRFVAGNIPNLKSRQSKRPDTYQASSTSNQPQHQHSGASGHKKGKGKRR